jgi:hypothetical protein
MRSTSTACVTCCARPADSALRGRRWPGVPQPWRCSAARPAGRRPMRCTPPAGREARRRHRATAAAERGDRQPGDSGWWCPPARPCGRDNVPGRSALLSAWPSRHGCLRYVTLNRRARQVIRSSSLHRVGKCFVGRPRRFGRVAVGPKRRNRRQQISVLAHAVAGPLDVYDDRVMEQPIQPGRGDDGSPNTWPPLANPRLDVRIMAPRS